MALAAITPWGLNQVRITNQGGTNPVALPHAMTLTIRPRIASEEFEAEGVIVGVAAWAVAADWELEAGGIALNAWARLTGLSAVDAGSGANEVKTLAIPNGHAFPYVRIYGKSLGDAGDDIHVKLYRAKCTRLEGTFERGEFFVTACSGVAVADGSGNFYELVQHETAANL